jgi:biopolymer transport protein ExbD
MAGLQKGDGDDIIAEINVTPFVDVVLVLLIIFMVTSAAIVKAAIEVDLPKAASGGQALETTLNIVVTKSGDVKLNGEDTTDSGIRDFIKSKIAEDPKMQAVIAADKGVPYGRVVRIIDVVKTSGVRSFALNIERDVTPDKD